MRDPLEGLTATGLIRTGASRERIPDRYVDLLEVAAARIRVDEPEASVYVYGSVAKAAPVLADALESARATLWWFNVWPVLPGAGRWFEADGNARAAAVIEGYFEARGRTRDVDDLVIAPATDPTTYVNDRRAGAAMSADDIVDYVLDELRSAEPAATKH